MTHPIRKPRKKQKAYPPTRLAKTPSSVITASGRKLRPRREADWPTTQKLTRQSAPPTTRRDSGIDGPLRPAEHRPGKPSTKTKADNGRCVSALVHNLSPEGEPSAAANDESFLLVSALDGGKAEETFIGGDSSDGSRDERQFRQLMERRGSADLPGNCCVAVPRWILYYFQDPEAAILLAQILYWFGRNQRGMYRARRKDAQERRVIDKTHRELADEVGIANERRIERLLRQFKAKGLLDYNPRHGVGKGRATRIWLEQSGLTKAYREGSRRAHEIEHDRNGGS